MIRFGVIGVGIIGTAHCHRISGLGGTQLACIADENSTRAEALAAELGVPAGSVPQLLARPDIDAVVVAVPSGLHADVTVAALEAGKHVFLEKPIDVTVDAADRIIDAEKRSGRVLTVASQRRFAAENRFVHQAIRTGLLGTVTSATVEVALWRTQEYYDSGAWRGTWALDGGGALMNQGVHLVDMALWLLGDVDEVYAHAGLLAHERIEVEDTITITARLKSGALLTFLATTAAYDGLPVRYVVAGDGGSAVIEAERLRHFVSATGQVAPSFDGPPVDQPLEQLADFVEAVRTGAPPLVTSVQARAAVAFIEAAYESARTGKPVTPR
ncbi:MAG TPA: Gfo/Idh/MocA family oxidoreductase [Candidatus Limnocylindrales bacterium]